MTASKQYLYIDSVVKWGITWTVAVLSCLGCISGCAPEKEPGKLNADDIAFVPIRRLNHAEYTRTFSDLIEGLDPASVVGFPPEATAFGFDNNAAVLTVSPLLVEKLALTASKVSAGALYDPGALAGISDSNAQAYSLDRYLEPEDLELDFGTSFALDEASGGTVWTWWTSDSIAFSVQAEDPGTYRITMLGALAAGTPGPDGDYPRIQVSLDDKPIGNMEMTPGTAIDHAFLASFTPGVHIVTVRLLDANVPEGVPSRGGLAALEAMESGGWVVGLDFIHIEGPVPDPSATPNPARDAILQCEPDDEDWTPCATEIVQRFGRRAWRRPLSDEEIGRLVELALVPQSYGDAFDEGIRLALEAILLSPHFIFRVELDDGVNSDDVHELSPHELAVRLSYLLWSSMPDETLSQCADDGGLAPDAEDTPKDCTLAAQADRMLQDPRATTFADRFSSQWLHLDRLNMVAPDPTIYPDFDDALRESMRWETLLVFRTFFDEGMPALDLLDAPFTFVDQALSDHYQLSDGPEIPSAFKRVDLSGVERSGVLTHAGVLSATSYPTRTSPTRRGKWVLSQWLCREPPPAPQGVPAIDEATAQQTGLRAIMEQHTSDPVCAGCHVEMDPIGFGLEHYDPIGRWRENIDGEPIDAEGTLANGDTFSGARQLATALKSDPDVERCILEHVFTYALGRAVQLEDDAEITAILDEGVLEDGFASLVSRIIESPQFSWRRGETAE